jgi:hypothetical protein
MSKYAVFFTLKARPSPGPCSSQATGSRSCPRRWSPRAANLSSTGSFEHLETHELIEAEDVNPILEQAKGITSQLPGT